ncbi:Arsenical resistance operon trans-acting repressor ArsD [Alteribacillus persepolensis]|uniref:Arsenical resistance operon trans-acting repressor ArsD n=1 Tax=Alteribacillus persepolensis TaxID=568899 RepID=A0A1G8GNQ1_9BACI|nr:arsenite efflux transporter metallochaperone ArsD [Alteribacillus persepolensis]SDH96002.1 Arsenical resistance operon trans-acting repressor ArsD [Alteribacillus persepolensis]
MTLKIFDPALCCPTGVCGPDVDPELTRIASDLHVLKSNGFAVERYNLAQEPDPFIQHKQVERLMNEQGTDVLPVTLLDEEVVKSGDYPSREELSHWLDISSNILEKGSKPSKADITIR